MRDIVVPLDGSSLAEKAVPLAIALAGASGAHIHFIRAVQPAADFAPGALDYNEDVCKDAQDYLDGSLAAVTDQGIQADAMVVEDTPHSAVLKAIESHQADMIVMSTHGRGGLARVVWGSVADYVLQEAPVPIFLVPKNVDFTGFGTGTIRLVVPLDGSDVAEEALTTAEDLALALNAEIILVRALEQDPWELAKTETWTVYGPLWDDVRTERTNDATTYLDDIATQLNAKGITTSVVLGEFVGAAELIGKAVQENGARAVIMASHGRGGLARTILGSISDAVVRTSHVPVLIVRPSSVRAQAAHQPAAPAPVVLRTAPFGAR